MIAYRMHSPVRSVLDFGGAIFVGGRWHSAGTPVLYAAEHVSLAALEILVHAEGTRIPPRAVTEIFISDLSAIEEARWMDLPESRQFGDTWAREQRSLVLRVPSIVADKMEFNLVINPSHASFALIKEGKSRPFHFDERFVHFPD